MVREIVPPKGQSKLDRFDYYENNKAGIIADLETLPRKQVIHKYGMPSSSLVTLLKRWGKLPQRVYMRVGPVGGKGEDNKKEMRLAWLEGYYQAMQDERRQNGR